MQIWSSAPLYIYYWISRSSGSTEQNSNYFFSLLCIETKIKIKLGISEKVIQRQLRRASLSGWLRPCELWQNFMFRGPKGPFMWTVRTFGTKKQGIIYVWFQHYKKKISNFSNPLCYSFLLTGKTFNLLSSRKRTSSCRPELVIVRYLIYWTFLEEQQVLIHSWTHTKLQEQKAFSPKNGLGTLTKWTINKFSRVMGPTVNLVAAIFSKQNTGTRLYYSKKTLAIRQTVFKLKLSKPPPTGIENYEYLQQLQKQEQVNSSR